MINDNKVVGSSSSRVDETFINSSKNKKFKNLTCILNIEAKEKFTFLTPNIKKTFN